MRHYSPKLGRFLSTDPAGIDPANPQSWNRYAYVRNNPFTYVDPDGEYLETAWDAFNLTLDVYLLKQDLTKGNYTDAAVDLGGLIIDSAALILPAIPAGAGIVIKATRSSEKVASTIVKGLPEGARFAQRSYSEIFSPEGRKVLSEIADIEIKTIDDLASAIKSGKVNPKDIPVNVIIRDGNTIILNTRTVQALERAGIPREGFNVINKTGDKMYEELLNRQLRGNKLTSEGYQNPVSR